MVFNQLASWLFSTSKADTRALPPRRKCGWNVPSYLFERSFGLGSSVEDVRPADLDVWACARRVVSATLRCDEFLRFPSSLRKTFGIQFHAQKALPLRSKAATARDPLPSQKKRCPRGEEEKRRRRSCARAFFMTLFEYSFLWRDDSIRSKISFPCRL